MKRRLGSYVTDLSLLQLRPLPGGIFAPDIAEAILEGTQPATLSTKRQLLHRNLPFRWSDQRRLLGFAQTQV